MTRYLGYRTTSTTIYSGHVTGRASLDSIVLVLVLVEFSRPPTTIIEGNPRRSLEKGRKETRARSREGPNFLDFPDWRSLVSTPRGQICTLVETFSTPCSLPPPFLFPFILSLSLSLSLILLRPPTPVAASPASLISQPYPNYEREPHRHNSTVVAFLEGKVKRKRRREKREKEEDHVFAERIFCSFRPNEILPISASRRINPVSESSRPTFIVGNL